ncbi:hypothetical protein BGZ72_005787 [Mortierella alpina]|nr:hypothetical protein BGZ72_005787 [Mortierella alpina]
MVEFINDTDVLITIVCTQNVVTVLKNGGAGVNAGPSGAELRVDILNEAIHVNEGVNTEFKIGPKQSQRMMIAHTRALVTVSLEDETRLYENQLVKKGYRHIVEQRDISNALKNKILTMSNNNSS